LPACCMRQASRHGVCQYAAAKAKVRRKDHKITIMPVSCSMGRAHMSQLRGQRGRALC